MRFDIGVRAIRQLVWRGRAVSTNYRSFRSPRAQFDLKIAADNERGVRSSREAHLAEIASAMVRRGEGGAEIGCP